MSTVERGYGRRHRKLKEQLRPMVDRGEAQCAEVICLMPTRWIAPGTAWDLAHGATRDVYRGPAHAKCNRAEAARRGNRMRGTTNAEQRRGGAWSSRRW